MWLSQNLVRGTSVQEKLQPGVVTVGGASPAVLTDGEKRNLKILSPGGYFWRPATGEKVLVSGDDGGCVLGKLQEAPALAPGEIRIVTGAAIISLLPSGEIHLTGDIYLNGEKWEGNQ